MNPWPDAERGEPIPGIKISNPPKFFSTNVKDRDYRKVVHDEVVLGVARDGQLVLCRYDQASDLWSTLDGKAWLKSRGGTFGGPLWYLPLAPM
jgi:hypothetical protein